MQSELDDCCPWGDGLLFVGKKAPRLPMLNVALGNIYEEQFSLCLNLLLFANLMNSPCSRSYLDLRLKVHHVTPFLLIFISSVFKTLLP